jgi:hypothetical protein
LIRRGIGVFNLAQALRAAASLQRIGGPTMIKQQRLAGPFAASLVLAVSLVVLPGTAFAFGCAEHFAAAQAAIDKVVEGMDGMGLDPRTTS